MESNKEPETAIQENGPKIGSGLKKIKIPVLVLPLVFIAISLVFVIIAAQFGNLPGFCSLIIKTTDRNMCYGENIAVKPIIPATKQTNPQESGNLDPRDGRFIKAAIATKDDLICYSYIKNEDDQKLCYAEVKKAASNPDDCETKVETVMAGGSYLGGTKDDCYNQSAKDRQDETICEKIKIQYIKDVCYMDVGEAKQDLSLCDKSGDFRDQCYESVSQTKPELSLCEKIKSQDFRERCYASVALIQKDPAICGKIQSNDTYWQQKNSCYAAVGIANQDCENLEKSFRNYCYAAVGGAKRDLKICDKIKDDRDATWKGKCYETVAVATQDASLCAKNPDKFSGGPCYREIGIAKQDLAICDMIKSYPGEQANYWEECYEGVAIAKSDESICDKLGAGTYGNVGRDCYSEIAANKQEPSICAKAGQNKDWCYHDVAIAKQDQSVCNNIENSNPKDECNKVTSAMWK